MISITHLPPLPLRPSDAHKGVCGTVIVVGGSETMMGAPALAASAALRAGAGLVKIATIAAALPTAIAIEPSATGIIVGDDIATALHQIERADPEHRAVLAIGPGLGQSERSRELVTALLAGPRAIVLDADGLNLLAASEEAMAALRRRVAAIPVGQSLPAPLILTPHPGEFLRLAQALRITASPTDPAQRPAAAAALANALHAVVLLKGRHSIVTDGPCVYTNQTGNPALATAGTGDVLTGVVASMVAQGMTAFDAAVLGAHLHGLAADLWARDHGDRGLTARDLAAMLPIACQRHATGK